MCLVLQRVGPVYCGQSEIVDDAEAEILLVTEAGGSGAWSRSAEEDLSRIRVDKSTADSWRHRNTVEPPGNILDYLATEVPGPRINIAPKIATIAYDDLPRGWQFWEWLRERYPRVTHYVILSAVGVSKDGNEALVLVSGDGVDAYILEWRRGRWRVRWVEGLTIS